MTLTAAHIDPPVEDPVSNVLKWVLLVVAIATFGLLAWATVETYRTAPPQPDRFVTADGTVLMTDDDIVAGKGGFQKADLMDYGSLYGMGSYYGEDYTASTLVRLGTATQNNVALATYGKPFAALTADQQAAATAVDAARAAGHGSDASRRSCFAGPLAAAIVTVRDDLAKSLNIANPANGLDAGLQPRRRSSRVKTADFLVFSALTTVARRPGVTWSWTQNWPYEPLVGNTPTTNTFLWTWISFCFTFFAFGVVLFIYEFFLNNPDDAPMDPVLATFRPLTPSQRRIGKYFLVVAALLLVQIGAGIDHGAFLLRPDELLRHRDQRFPALQLPARRPYPGADRLDRAIVDRRGAVPGARHRRRPGGQRPALAGGFPVLGDAAGRRRRADRRLSRHHGGDRPGLVLVRQPGPLLYPARPLLADRLLHRAGAVEPAGDAGAVAERGALAEGGRPVLDRAHPPGAPDLGLHDQHRGPLRVRHDPAHRDREVLHAHRLLALVGGPSLGRAVVRVLRRHHERLSADGGRPGLAQARRAGDLFRDHPDLPRRRHRHRPSPLLGRRSRACGCRWAACSPSSRCCRWCC